MDLSNDQITEILTEEAKRLDDISPSDHVEAKSIEQQKEVVKVMKILHAQELAEAQGARDILDALREEIVWAEIQLSGWGKNPHLDTNSPLVFCQRILEERRPAPPPVAKFSVDEALARLSKSQPKA